MKGDKHMQPITMHDVILRSRVINRSPFMESSSSSRNYIASNNFSRLIDNGYSRVVAESVISQISKTDASDFAFRQMLEVFDMICENETPSYISHTANILAEATNKTRTGTETKDYLKMKVARFKTKLHTKFNTNIANATTAASDAVEAMKKNLATNTQPIKDNIDSAKKKADSVSKAQTAREEAALAGYEKIYEAYQRVGICDRIITNQDKLTKHYDLKEMVLANFDEPQRAIIEICSAIDSFKMPSSIKYNTSLENTLYTFAQCGIAIDRGLVAETVTDYYLLNTNPLTEESKQSMCKILESNVLFSEKDASNIDNMFKDIAKLDIKFDDTFVLLQEKPDTSKYITENELFTLMMKEAKDDTNKVKVLFNKFKMEAEKTPDKLKSLIYRIYVQSPDEIIEELPNLLSWIRSFLVIGGGVAIHPIVGVVALMVDQAIKITLSRKQLASYISKFESERDKTKKAINNTKDNEEKQRLEAYKKQLDKNIDKLKDEEDRLYTDDENSARHLNDNDDDGFNDLFSDFSFEESAVVLTEMDIANTMKLAKENLKKTMKDLSDKEKTISRNIDAGCSQFTSAAERALVNDNREAVIKGSLIPSASKVIKGAIVAAAGWAVNPALAVIGVLGSIGISKKLQAKERQLILDDIEIELNMCERYLKIAEDNNDMKAQRNLLTTKRSLERQRQRIKYKMTVYHNQQVDNKQKDDDYDD